MNQEIKSKWVSALRSGEYQQGQGRLKQKLETGTVQYCCLGVLCDLAEKEGIVRSDFTGVVRLVDVGYSEYATYYSADRGTDECNSYALPLTVMRWAGFWVDPQVQSVEDSDPGLLVGLSSLSQLNDEGESFETIAGLIETKL